MRAEYQGRNPKNRIYQSSKASGSEGRIRCHATVSNVVAQSYELLAEHRGTGAATWQFDIDCIPRSYRADVQIRPTVFFPCAACIM